MNTQSEIKMLSHHLIGMLRTTRRITSNEVQAEVASRMIKHLESLTPEALDFAPEIPLTTGEAVPAGQPEASVGKEAA